MYLWCRKPETDKVFHPAIIRFKKEGIKPEAESFNHLSQTTEMIRTINTREQTMHKNTRIRDSNCASLEKKTFSTITLFAHSNKYEVNNIRKLRSAFIFQYYTYKANNAQNANG